MPTSALTFCAQMGCNTLVRRGRCGAHARPAWGGLPRLSRRGRGYDAEYARNRPVILARDPVCTLRIRCQGAPSDQVDHIIPGAGSALGNLRGACRRCNHARGSARGGSAPRRA